MIVPPRILYYLFWVVSGLERREYIYIGLNGKVQRWQRKGDGFNQSGNKSCPNLRVPILSVNWQFFEEGPIEVQTVAESTLKLRIQICFRNFLFCHISQSSTNHNARRPGKYHLPQLSTSILCRDLGYAKNAFLAWVSFVYKGPSLSLARALTAR